MTRVIGCGNILAYDEGLGIHAVRELKRNKMRPGVTLLEMRRPGLLLDELVFGSRKLILIDAVSLGRRAGAFERFELTGNEASLDILKKTVHGFNLIPVFERGLKSCEERMPQAVVLFAMEITERNKFSIGLSPPVQEALPQLIKAVLAEIEA
ncbi:MAG: hydrogenase maturation protease [Dethiobacter sp.]|jgi:hydrogenase maturation protease|nr:hydrogenase maturation protease [Dethiobacter sp.]